MRCSCAISRVSITVFHYRCGEYAYAYERATGSVSLTRFAYESESGGWCCSSSLNAKCAATATITTKIQAGIA